MLETNFLYPGIGSSGTSSDLHKSGSALEPSKALAAKFLCPGIGSPGTPSDRHKFGGVLELSRAWHLLRGPVAFHRRRALEMTKSGADLEALDRDEPNQIPSDRKKVIR